MSTACRLCRCRRRQVHSAIRMPFRTSRIGNGWSSIRAVRYGPACSWRRSSGDRWSPGFRTACTRFTTRSKEDKPCVSLSTAVLTGEDGKTAKEVRIGLGGVEAVFRRLTAVEDGLQGKELNQENIDAVLADALDDLDPLTDIRASGDYRKQVTPVLVRRTILKALGAF